MAMFNSKLLVYQRVNHPTCPLNPIKNHHDQRVNPIKSRPLNPIDYGTPNVCPKHGIGARNEGAIRQFRLTWRVYTIVSKLQLEFEFGVMIKKHLKANSKPTLYIHLCYFIYPAR